MTDDGPMPDDGSAGGLVSRRKALGVAGAAVATGLAGCGSFVQVDSDRTTEERTVNPEAVNTLAVTDATSDVAFVAERRDDIEIVARKRTLGGVSVEDLTVDAQVTDGRLEVTTDEPEVVGVGGGSVALELRAPRSIGVERLHTVDGDVSADGVADGAVLRTRDGDVAVTDARGDITARTTDGDVVIDGTAGAVTAKTQDGDVQVRSPDRVGEIATRDGDVTADVPAVTDEAVVESSDGDLLLRIGDAVGASISARTSDGELILSDGTARLDVHRRTDGQLEATVGDAGSRLTARTDDGDVMLRA